MDSLSQSALVSLLQSIEQMHTILLKASIYYVLSEQMNVSIQDNVDTIVLLIFE